MLSKNVFSWRGREEREKEGKCENEKGKYRGWSQTLIPRRDLVLKTKDPLFIESF